MRRLKYRENMPELPEVETIRKNLLNSMPRRYARSIVLQYIDYDFPVFQSKDKAEEIANLLVHHPEYYVKDSSSPARIKEIKRHGKYLLFNLWTTPSFSKDLNKWDYYHTPNQENHQDWTLIVHLGMSGQIIVKGDEKYGYDNRHEKDRHVYMVWKFVHTSDDGCIKWSSATFRDSRRFGAVFLVKGDRNTHAVGSSQRHMHPRLQKLGKDALRISAKDVDELCKSSKSIKAQLLDQSIVAGIGNIYADEICFASGIHPNRKANTILKEEQEKIVANTIEILNEAIKCGGSTIQSYVNGNGDKGGYQFHHKVYGKDGDECSECGNKIIKMKIVGRSTHYCGKCQR